MKLFKKGSKGSIVEAIQIALKKVGKLKIKVDGIFGPKTEKAVRDFQTGAKLKPDGIIGPKSFKALKMKPKDLAEKADKGPKPKPISVSYTVPKLKQPTSMSCWATAIAMMVSWKKRISIAPETIADVLGYTKEFKSKGMHPEDTKVFKAWGMKWEPPMCYTVQGFADLMIRHGPMWVAGNPKAPHVRVLIAMKGDGTADGTNFTINDPAGGRSYKQSFKKVMGNMEDLGASVTEMKMKRPVYVAHF